METIIKLENNSLISSEHLILTDKGLVKAKDLKVGDFVVNSFGITSKVERIIEGKFEIGIPPIIGEIDSNGQLNINKLI